MVNPFGVEAGDSGEPQKKKREDEGRSGESVGVENGPPDTQTPIPCDFPPKSVRPVPIFGETPNAGEKNWDAIKEEEDIPMPEPEHGQSREQKNHARGPNPQRGPREVIKPS